MLVHVYIIWLQIGTLSSSLFLCAAPHIYRACPSPSFGSEDRLAPVMGVMQSLASFVSMDNKDQLR